MSVRNVVIGLGIALAVGACGGETARFTDDDDGGKSAGSGGLAGGGAGGGLATAAGAANTGGRATGGSVDTGGPAGGGGRDAGRDGEAGSSRDAMPPPESRRIRVRLKNDGFGPLYVVDNEVNPAWLAIDGVRRDPVGRLCGRDDFIIGPGLSTRRLDSGITDELIWFGDTSTRSADDRGECWLHPLLPAGAYRGRACAFLRDGPVSVDGGVPEYGFAESGIDSVCTDVALELPEIGESVVEVALSAPRGP